MNIRLIKGDKRFRGKCAELADLIKHLIIMAFKNKLEKNQINVTIRRVLGQDIDGACGQLRRRYPE